MIRNVRTGLVLAAAMAALLVVAPQAAAFQAVYRVVALTHSSSSRKSDPPFYTGSSTSTWSLAPPTKKAPNVITVYSVGSLVTGLGMVNIRGVFKAEASTNRPGRCTLTAPTGSKKYGLVAPAAFQFGVAPDPKSANRVLAVHGLGFNIHATLGNPYFGSECSTSLTGEPDADDMMGKSVPKSTFRQKRVVLRYVGSRSANKIVYRWSTTFTLKRIKFTP
jgi:hypothetical protein